MDLILRAFNYLKCYGNLHMSMSDFQLSLGNITLTQLKILDSTVSGNT